MNPSRWFGGDRDRYYDDYRYGPYGYGGPYGRYGGPYGWGGPYGGGWGGPYGYGGGPWGGWGGYPGYGPGSTIVVTPQGGGSRDSQPAPGCRSRDRGSGVRVGRRPASDDRLR
jgi:hypothetical protein